MPLSHRRLALWYTTLAQQLDAGLRLRDALRSHSGAVPGAMAAEMALAIDRGGSVDDALKAAGRWLPYVDALTLSAAAEAGRLPELLRNLAARHVQVGAAHARLVMAAIYPLLVLHFAIFLLPVTRMIDWEQGFHWSSTVYGRSVLGMLLPLWAVVAALIWVARRQPPWSWRVARRLPLFGRYLEAQALGDFAFALGNFVEAGVPIGDAWAAAALVTPSPALKACGDAMAAVVARGAPPGLELGAWKCLPPEFSAPYRSGEISGRLESALLGVAAQQQERANRALTVATIVYPVILFACVALGVVATVVAIYGSYLKMITKLAQ